VLFLFENEGGKIATINIPIEKEVKFPKVCACCLKPCESDSELVSIQTLVSQALQAKAKVFELYVCHFCQDHWKKTQRYYNLLRWMEGFGILAFILVAVRVSRIYKVSGFGKAALFGIIGAAVICGVIFLISRPFKPKEIEEPGHIETKDEPVVALNHMEGDKEFTQFKIANEDIVIIK